MHVLLTKKKLPGLRHWPCIFYPGLATPSSLLRGCWHSSGLFLVRSFVFPDKITKTSQITTSTEEVERALPQAGGQQSQRGLVPRGVEGQPEPPGLEAASSKNPVPLYNGDTVEQENTTSLLSYHLIKLNSSASQEASCWFHVCCAAKKPERDVLSSETKLCLFFGRQMLSAIARWPILFRERKHVFIYGGLFFPSIPKILNDESLDLVPLSPGSWSNYLKK